MSTTSPYAAIARADFDRVSVFFGANSDKYPDGNQVVFRGSDTLAALDTPPKTLAQRVERRLLYPPDCQTLWVVSAETRTISRHLAELLADGRVKVDERGVYRAN